MNPHVPHGPSSLETLAVQLPSDSTTEADARRQIADRARFQRISRHLDEAWVALEQAIQGCVRRESEADWIEVDRGQAAPRHLTQIDSLQRLRLHLDRVIAWFRSVAEANEVARPSEAAAKESLNRTDGLLDQQAAALFQQFSAPDNRHDFQADVESHLREFERLLIERAVLCSSSQSSSG